MNRKLVWIAGGIVAVILLVLILIPLFFNANRYRPEIESRLTQALGRQVKIGDLKLSLFSGGINASDISIADDPAYSREPFIRAKSLTVGVQLKPLLFDHKVNVDALVLNDPVVRLLQSSSGKWNVSTLGQKQKKTPSDQDTSDIKVSQLEISNGRVELGRANGKTVAYTDVNLKVTDFSGTSSFPYELSAKTPGGGTLSVQGKAGPMNAADSSRTPFIGDVTISDFDLAATGMMGSDSGLAGALDYKGKIASDGRTVTSSGTAKASKLQLVKGGSSASQPVEISYSSKYDLAREQGALDRTTIRTGKSTANLSGTFASRGATTDLDLKMTGDKMPLPGIQGLLPALGVVLPAGSSLQGGTVSTNLNLRGPTEKLVTTGTVDIANARLAGFSLSKGLSTLAALSGLRPSSDTTIQTLASNLRIAPDGTRVDNLNLVVAEVGDLTGHGTIAANGALDFHLVAKLAGGSGVVGALTQIAGAKVGGLQNIPIAVTGTTAKPVFLPDVGSALAGKNLSSGTETNQQQPNPVGSILSLFGGKKKK